MGMCGPEDPLFTPLLPLAWVPFQAKESVRKTPFWENLEILASNLEIFSSQAPNLEIFSSQAPKFGNFLLTSPPFQRQMSVRKPHTSEIRGAHPYLKKSWVPPGDESSNSITVHEPVGPKPWNKLAGTRGNLFLKVAPGSQGFNRNQG